jgi:hypothetical protein
MTERLARVEERRSRLVIARETVKEVLSGPAAGQSQVCQPSLPATEVPVQSRDLADREQGQHRSDLLRVALDEEPELRR